jgi:hypothetical protein
MPCPDAFMGTSSPPAVALRGRRHLDMRSAMNLLCTDPLSSAKMGTQGTREGNVSSGLPISLMGTWGGVLLNLPSSLRDLRTLTGH